MVLYPLLAARTDLCLWHTKLKLSGMSHVGQSSISLSEILFSTHAGNDAGVGLDMRNLHLSSTNASTFENLPKHWRIPLERVKLVCVDGQAIVLGRGGFGDVYQAIVRQEQAALKTVRGGDPKEQARLLHEIKVLEQCRSVHIVQFLGYSVAGNRLLLAMELLRGGSLYNALRQNDEFQWYNRWGFTWCSVHWNRAKLCSFLHGLVLEHVEHCFSTLSFSALQPADLH